MAVPTFEAFRVPLLRRLQDGKDHRMADLYDVLADDLHLTDGDRSEILSSGLQPVYKNRISWARTFLKKAGLIDQPSRGVVRISVRGRDALASGKAIDNAYLMQFPEFAAFFRRPRENGKTTVAIEAPEDESPDDTLERVHRQLRDDLAQELLERIKVSSPAFFEKLVVDLMIRMGYGGSREDAGKTVGRSGDGGIDGVINEDRLGLDVIYLQAKRWENTVGRPVVQGFVGSLAGKRANKGVLITTSDFSREARDYVDTISSKIVLIDGETLGSLMIQYGLAVTPVASYDIKRVDSDYFDE
ncbi:MAG: restriction endonuclease [Proteobacteria bacterium]|nr:restriction endonuclease [Pseudomonadota bacterium]